MSNARIVAQWAWQRSAVAVVGSSALAVAVLAAGPVVVGRPLSHRFLVWNLTLAWVPYLAALAFEALWNARRRIPALVPAVTAVLFLPNAPYLMTDLTHLRAPSATPWLDIPRFLAFAWAGCLLGVATLRIFHRIVSATAGSVAGAATVVGAAAASGVGVVLGRFARLNSWDAITSPSAVLLELARFRGDVRAIGLCVFFTLLLLLIYLGLAATGPRHAHSPTD